MWDYCPYCTRTHTKKYGEQSGRQRCYCNECRRAFQLGNNDDGTELWLEYVFHKQTVRELSETYGKDKRTIKKELVLYTLPEKIHTPRATHLIIDATYFGDRLEDTSWCVVVFRDFYEKEDLWWSYVHTETTSVYHEGRQYLEEAWLGHSISDCRWIWWHQTSIF